MGEESFISRMAVASEGLSPHSPVVNITIYFLLHVAANLPDCEYPTKLWRNFGLSCTSPDKALPAPNFQSHPGCHIYMGQLPI